MTKKRGEFAARVGARSGGVVLSALLAASMVPVPAFASDESQPFAKQGTEAAVVAGGEGASLAPAPASASVVSSAEEAQGGNGGEAVLQEGGAQAPEESAENVEGAQGAQDAQGSQDAQDEALSDASGHDVLAKAVNEFSASALNAALESADAALTVSQAEPADVAEGEVAIDEATFPDPVFRVWVWRNIAGGGSAPWKLTKEQLESTTSIVLAPNDGVHYDTTSVKDLTGISCFYNLQELNFRDNKGITSVDLSKNTKLTSLDGRSSGLVGIDLSANGALESANLRYCKLASLTLPAGNALAELLCSNNKLVSINGLSQCAGLKKFEAHYNDLESLDISGCESLEWVKVNNNALSALDFSKNGKLTTVICDNQLSAGITTLGLNTAVRELYCSGNKLTSLDVSQCKDLEILACCTNPGLATLNVTGCSKLTELNCYGDALTTLDVSTNPVLTSLNCYSNALTTLDVSHNPALETLNAKDCGLTSVNVGAKETVRTYNLADNKLLSLDLSQCIRVGAVETKNNVTEIEVVGDTFSLASLGIDATKVMAAEGAVLDRATGMLSGVVGGTDVVYTYAAGANMSLTFTLRPNVTIATEGALVRVVDAQGNEVKSPKGASLTVDQPAQSLSVKGATTLNGAIVIPNDARGKAPVAATVQTKDTDSDGKPDEATVRAYYPMPVVGDVDEAALCDLNGEEVYVNAPMGSNVSVVDEQGNTMGRVYYGSYNSVWIDRDKMYSHPIAAQVVDIEKDASTGLVSKVVVKAWYPTLVTKESGLPVYDKDGNRVVLRQPVSPDVKVVGDNAHLDGTWGVDLTLVAADKGIYPAVTTYLDPQDTDSDGQIDVIGVEVVYPIPVVNEKGEPLYTSLTERAQTSLAMANMLDKNVVLKGCTLEGSYKDGKLVVPNDKYGNAPVMVAVDGGTRKSDYNDEGGSYRVTVVATYPVQVVGEDGSAVASLDGGNATIPALETADEETVVNGGAYDRETNTVVVQNDQYGNAPLAARVSLDQDGDQDGRYNVVTVSDFKYPTMFILADGSAYRDANGYLSISSLVSENVEVTGGAAYSPDDNTVLVPDDANGNPPLKVSATWQDADGDGLVDKIDVQVVYPLASPTFVMEDGTPIPSDKLTVTDGAGGSEILDAVSPNVVVTGAVLEGSVITVPNSSEGKAPLFVTVVVKDADGDGYIDVIDVRPVYESPAPEPVPAPEPGSDPVSPGGTNAGGNTAVVGKNAGGSSALAGTGDNTAGVAAACAGLAVVGAAGVACAARARKRHQRDE